MFHTENDRDFWRKVLANIELEISKPKFLLYFKNTSAQASEDTLTISCPSSFIKEGLEKNFKTLISQTAAKLTPHAFRLEFSIAPPKPLPHPKELGPLFSVKNGNFHPAFTFENFVVGPENELAFAVARNIAKGEFGLYNPFFVHAPSGLGKTHLLQAIGKEAGKNPKLKILYARSEEFTNELIASLKQRGKSHLFRQKYRSVDLFLLDDTQFFAGKKVSQEELFNTLNYLQLSGKQIVVSSDKEPKEIGLEKRLISRFLGGLSVFISEPGYELKKNIIAQKTKALGVRVSAEEASQLALKVCGSVREIEGALLQIKAGRQILGKDMESVLRNFILNAALHPSSGKILEAVCAQFAVTKDELLSKGKKKPITSARKAACFLLEELTDSSFSQIGQILGAKHHTTILYNLEMSKKLLQTDPVFGKQISAIKASLQNF